MRVSVAWAGGWTVGPGCGVGALVFAAADGSEVEVGFVACVMVEGDGRVGYLRGVEDAAVRAALEVEDPITAVV